MNIVSVEFVRSAASPADFPRDGAPQVALVGRSNVGKSSLINALVKRRIARTSAAAGRTRLANFYRVRLARGGRGGLPFASGASPGAAVRHLYLVDLPGYGYARDSRAAAERFRALASVYFGQADRLTALLVVDGRHPGLPHDRDAHAWLAARALPIIIVATKMDCLTRAARERAVQQHLAAWHAPVLPVSAVTGEGMDDLWTWILALAQPTLPASPPRMRQ